VAASAPAREDRKQAERKRDLARRVDAAKRLTEVQQELEDAMARRTELWHEQASEPDRKVADEVRALSDRINVLWAEARARRACIRQGSRERILSRVRAEARFEREVRKVQGALR
jgi:hypothetical protein